MKPSKFYKDLNALCKKHNLTIMHTRLEDKNPQGCAALQGIIGGSRLGPLTCDRGGTEVHIELYTPDNLVIEAG